MSESPSPALGRRSVLLILCAFIGSRIAYFAGGIRFDLSPLNYHWQLIDTVLMRTDLLRSLFYLHMQPPGFNLVIGLVVKLVPHYYGAVLQVLYLVMDLSISLLLLLLMLLLGVTPVVARALTALFVISPGSVLFANIVAYECPVLLLLLASATCLLRLYRQPSRARAFTFFA